MIKSIMIGLCILLSSCASQSSLYHWGNYESLLYDMYVKPDKATPVKQIEIITKDIRFAQKQQKKMAPGIYAHLGMLYAQVGDEQGAVAALKMEKTLYPESQVMIDGLISRAFPGVPLDSDDQLTDATEAKNENNEANQDAN
ncbi:DUF4810 domain-containing protein [Marinicellulosiphila megalodicopiae]|uniref:DUF4810 domain-containing protein n=1 Tax=Marinicellulosiphila megalodicopiae TaxID=2724896 RepID=UPI003BAE6F3B